jgi:4-hydroxy-4-methyl-2-oxoglutarate aldolase
MIEEPPILTIRRDFPRPSAEDLADLGSATTGFLVDAMGGRGALDHHIKPVCGADELPQKFCGPAMTCFCGPADIMAEVAAIELAQPGDVVVVGTDAYEGTAVFGDLLTGIARNRGLAALVTDGLVRDVEGIAEVGLPVFARGVSPNSPTCAGPGTVGLPISLGGVTIGPGDVIVGDRDGVVVVALDKIAEVRASLSAVRAAEQSLEARVKNGLERLDITKGIMESDRIRWLD